MHYVRRSDACRSQWSTAIQPSSRDAVETPPLHARKPGLWWWPSLSAAQRLTVCRPSHVASMGPRPPPGRAGTGLSVSNVTLRPCDSIQHWPFGFSRSVSVIPRLSPAIQWVRPARTFALPGLPGPYVLQRQLTRCVEPGATWRRVIQDDPPCPYTSAASPILVCSLINVPVYKTVPRDGRGKFLTLCPTLHYSLAAQSQKELAQADRETPMRLPAAVCGQIIIHACPNHHLRRCSIPSLRPPTQQT
jgi:hypothetical protein